MMTTITAKYRGQCRICEGVILPGDRIEWERGSKIVTHADCAAGVRRATNTDPGRPSDYDDDRIEDDDHAGRARYHRSRVSNVTTFSSGATIYTNKRGRCEDAPCCGCCS